VESSSVHYQKSNFVEKRTFHPIKCFSEKMDGNSKRERMEIIDLHLKCVFAGCYY